MIPLIISYNLFYCLRVNFFADILMPAIKVFLYKFMNRAAIG